MLTPVKLALGSTDMLLNSVRKTGTFDRVGYTYLITPSPMSVKPGEVHPGLTTVSLLRTIIILLLVLVLIMTVICPITSHWISMYATS